MHRRRPLPSPRLDAVSARGTGALFGRRTLPFLSCLLAVPFLTSRVLTTLFLLTLVPAVSCASGPPPAAPAPEAAPSFDTQVFATPVDCCSTCRGIGVSVRNIGEASLFIDWSRTTYSHNGQAVPLVTPKEEGAITEVRSHTTWEGTLRPPVGAPNAASLKEGRFRNGAYKIDLALAGSASEAVPSSQSPRMRATVRTEIDYASALAGADAKQPGECDLAPALDRHFSARPAGWPDIND